MESNFIFQQLFESETSTYTYLLGDFISREAILIDPVLEMLERDLKLLGELKLQLKYSLETHIHADHITAAGELRKRTGCRTGAAAAAQISCVDLPLKEGQIISFGSFDLRVLETPGHTRSCLSYYRPGYVFTGDSLMIRGTGRTDFQEGSSECLYRSITEKLFCLPPETRVYPAHDYKGFTQSSIALEKIWNPRVGQEKSLEDFIKIMSELKLTQPKKINEAVPANRACGTLVQS